MSEKQTVVVAGATGRAGRLIVKELVERGFSVRALLVEPFDKPDQPELTGLGVDLVTGNLTNESSLEQCMRGAHFLISAIGGRKPFSKKDLNTIDNMGNRNLASAAKKQGLQHIAVISSNGVGNSRWAINLMHKLSMHLILKAKEKSEDFIRTCGISYTILRPGGYNEEGLSGEIVYGENGGLSGHIGRGEIARACADALVTPAMKNKTLEVLDRAKVREGRDQYIIDLKSS
ncbi:MAG: SDR family oxidoreductase [Deltaproteobacteria bacterium]|nr:SDR family oxidoreductase [Deltaproteobacteria bacterium]